MEKMQIDDALIGVDQREGPFRVMRKDKGSVITLPH